MKPPPMPEPTVGLGVHRWAYGTKDIEARDAQWAALLADAVAQERERCARVCDEASAMSPDALVRHMANGCANAIRFPENMRAQTDSNDG